MTLIDSKWLKDRCACEEGIEWFERQDKRESDALIKCLIEEKHPGWAVWLADHTDYTGVITAYRPCANSNLVDFQYTFKDGERHGYTFYYHKSGRLALIIYHDEHGRMKWSQYYKDELTWREKFRQLILHRERNVDD